MSGSGQERGPTATADLVSRVLEEVGLSEASAGMRLMRAWDEALGPDLSPHCRPEGLRRGVIQALVRDSAWMQRLQMERPRILANLREAVPEEADLAIRFRIGPFED
jgi:predicted nucleic acid-binding Zn ribbon protein